MSFPTESTRSTAALQGSAVLYLYQIKRFFSASFWKLDNIDELFGRWGFISTKLSKIFVALPCRGGVEDTRLEAKAKDTKKIRGQGQGQPFRGQTLSRPRTGMLEAKAKDQGHKAQVLSKKKKKKTSSQKFFRRSPKKKKKKKKKKRSSQKFFKRSPRKNAFQKIFQPLHKILTFQKIVLSSSRGQANFRGLEASRPRPRTWPSRPRPRTSKSVLKDVLEDSTSAALASVICLFCIKNQKVRPNVHFRSYHCSPQKHIALPTSLITN